MIAKPSRNFVCSSSLSCVGLTPAAANTAHSAVCRGRVSHCGPHSGQEQREQRYPARLAGAWQPRQTGPVYWRGPPVMGASCRITSPGPAGCGYSQLITPGLYPPMSRVATRCLPTPGAVTMRKGAQCLLCWGQAARWCARPQ